MFSLVDTFSTVRMASGPVFLLYAPRLVFGGSEGVGSSFHVLRPRTRFRRFRPNRVPFSCFLRPNSFSAVSTVSCPVFMFCAPGLVFGDSEGVGSRFLVVRSRNHFRRYRGRRLPFSCFARPNSFSAVYNGVRSRFHLLRTPDSFSAVPTASCPVFMFCAPGHVFGGSEGVGSRFHVLRSRTLFGRCGGRRVPFECFALPDSSSAVPRASGAVFMFCAPELAFSGTKGVGSHFHVLRARTHFRRYRQRRVIFSSMALPDTFSAVPRASGPVLIFCAPGLIFGGTEGVG
jgi:hypothetical protein